jgi:hypothetical protein
MSSHAGFDTAAEALDFIFAGQALVTITSVGTGKHFTFKIGQKKNNNDGSVSPFFVKHLFGPDNSWDGDWSFLGFVPDRDRDRLIAGRRGLPQAPSFKALNWVLKRLAFGEIPPTLTIQHNAACGACGRPLTDPISVATGLGPICRSK